jgi:hypothetical protein
VSLWVKFKRAFAPKHAVFEKRLHQARMPALTPGAPLVRFEAVRLVRPATAESEPEGPAGRKRNDFVCPRLRSRRRR